MRSEINYERDAKEDYLVNSLTVYNILEKCRNMSSYPRIIYSSAAMIYGLAKKMPINDDSYDNPPSIWAIHKLIGEKYWWLRFVNLSGSLFVLMPLLLVISFIVKSYKNKKIKEQWIKEEEENIENIL